MAEKRVIELEIQDNVKSLKTQYREAIKEVQNLSAAYGETSKQAVKAARAAAELKDQIEFSNELIKGFNPDAKFAAVEGAIGGVLNGFQAFEGGLALVGVESEDLQKTMVKLQAVMALTQGINGILEAKDKFKQLGTVVKTAFQGMTAAGKAFAVTGIGLIITGIAVLVASYDKLANKEKEYAEARQAALDASIQGIERESELAQARAELQGKSQAQILELQRQGLEKKAKELADAADTEYRIYEKLYKNDWGAINDETKAAYDKHVELQKQQNNTVHELNLLNIKIQKQAQDDAKAIRNKAIEDEKKLNEESAKRAKDRADKIKQKRDSDLSELKGYIKEASKATAQGQMDDTEKALDEVKRKYERQIALAKKYGKGTSEIEIAMMNEINDIHLAKVNKQIEQENEVREQARLNRIRLENEFLDTIADLEEENYQRKLSDEEKEKRAVNEKYFELETLATGNAEQLAIIETAKRNELNEINKKYDQIEKERLKRNRDFAIEMTLSSLQTIQSLTDLFSKKSEKAARTAFRINKVAQIASATISTYKSAVDAYASQFLPVPEASSPVRGGIAAGVAVAAGLANIAKISSQKFEGGGGGGSGNNVPNDIPSGNINAPQFNTIGSSGINQLAQLQQQPIQAYVVSGQVTSAQALDRNRIQNSSL